MSEIPKRGFKVPGYEGGRLLICNIDGGRNAMEVLDKCDILILHKVRYERETMTGDYIIKFIYQREGLMVLKGNEVCVWCCEAAVRS